MLLLGGAYYYIKNDGLRNSSNVVIISTGAVTITLPEKFTSLEIIERERLDKNGCAIDYKTVDVPPGFLCIRKDPIGGGILFDTQATAVPNLFANEQNLNDFIEGLESDDPQTNVEQSMFMGEKSLIMTKETNSDGVQKLQKVIIFMRNGKLYSFGLTAQRETTLNFWPDILKSIEDAKFSS